MAWWFGGGLVSGGGVFLAYRRWFMRVVQAPLEAHRSHEAELERRRVMEEVEEKSEAALEALRRELRATPGLERYADIIGRSTIRSVEDARVREARVSELRADPVKAKYAERVFNGETITDAMIAYWEVPAARRLCAHLSALETDVRAAGPHTHPLDATTLESPFSFDFEALKLRYRTDDAVTFWRQPFGPEFWGKGEDDYGGWERIECTRHRCALRGCVHRPPFPAGP